jgi:hypothetical protein
MALEDIFFGSGSLVTNTIEEIPTGLLYSPNDISFESRAFILETILRPSEIITIYSS